MRKCNIIIFGLLLIATITIADTHIPPGDVSGIWTISGSPYIIDGEINITVDSTLIIEPGVQVLFSGHYMFYIYGRLLAEGTVTDTILFTAQDTTVGWHGLRFHNTNTNGQDSSKIVYCKLEYGKATGSYPDYCGGAIYCENSSGISIKYCLITKNHASNHGGGIYCYYSSPSIDNSAINGNTSAYGGGIWCCESSPSLNNITIRNNVSSYGGGLFFTNNSSPSLENVTIIGNYSGWSGGGICCFNSSPSLTNINISGNTVYYYNGGGIYLMNSNPILTDVTINENIAYYGGGIHCDNSSPMLTDVTINENGADYGGGIYCYNNSSPILTNIIINGNTADVQGGGIQCYNNSNPSLENVTVSGNIAYANNDGGGGGISCYDSNPSFDPINRCNIFLNFTGNVGNDLYVYECPTINVIVDTFTVLQPSDYFAYSIDNFTFDILNAKVEQVNHDLYVSTTGSNDNSGLIPEDPLLTISYAFAKIVADSINPYTIHLANGTYSPVQTSEMFPLNCRSYVSLQGEDEDSTVLDGEGLSRILYCNNDNYFSIGNMTIQNGAAFNGGGIICKNSNPNIINIIIRENTASYGGGGIYCSNSNPSLNNIVINENTSAYYGGGIYCCDNSSPILVYVTICENSGMTGGGISCSHSSPSLTNVKICGNTSSRGGGVYCYNNSTMSLINIIISENAASWIGGGVFCEESNISLFNVLISGNSGGGIYFFDSNSTLTNVTFSKNTADEGSGIFCSFSNPCLLNCILWNDTPQEIYLYGSTISATYSDIQGGWSGEGNIDTDPLFVDPENGDYRLSWANFPIPDSTKSPCIDTGTQDTTGLNLPPWDLAGNPRIVNGRIDMGAYEWQGIVGVDELNEPSIATGLFQNYPNPFSSSTIISFNLATKSHPFSVAVLLRRVNKKAQIKIYNIKGQLVRTLTPMTNDQCPMTTIEWDGKDENGKPVSLGIYFYQLSTRGGSTSGGKVGDKIIDIKKCLLLK